MAAVVAFHLGHLTGGYLGVDLFFVLSGYLITSLLLVEWAGSGRIALSAFYARRFRRLLPAVVVVVAVVGVFSHWEVLITSRDELRMAGLATMAYVANWAAIFSAGGYWDRTLVPSWLEHTWSLAIEEQFYVAWPLVVVLALRRRRRPVAPDARGSDRVDAPRPAPTVAQRRKVFSRLAALAGLGALASGTTMIVWSFLGGTTQRLYLGTDTRAAALLMGCWAACRQQVRSPAPGSPLRLLLARAGACAAGFLAVAWLWLDGSGSLLYRGGLLLAGIAATVVIVDLTTPGASFVRRPFELAPLRYLGLISYGLYLWHWPVIQYLYVGRFGLRGARLDLARVGVSLALALVSFFLVERPIRRWPLGHIRPVPVLGAIGVCIVALLVGTAGGYDVHVGGKGQRGSTTRTAGAPTVLVVGDSVAVSLAEDGLVPAGRGLGLSVADRAQIGCSLMEPVGDAGDGDGDLLSNCSPDFPADLSATDPDVVFVLFGRFVGVVPDQVDGEEAWPCDPAWDRRWRERLDGLVDQFSADGAEVVLSTAPTATAYYLKLGEPELFDARQACSNAVVREVASRRTEAVLYDLAGLVCPTSTTCRSRLDGRELRTDGLHYDGAGARVVTRRLGPALVRAAGP
ncbi:hypothetical protein BH10ACT1_BH10ACT1_37760 [soil metagenome]